MNGGQIAYFINGAGETQGVSGCTIQYSKAEYGRSSAGIINIAGQDVAGVQVGIINICKNLQGLQIGAVNVVRGRFP
jgi:hypothetical protein